MSIKNDRERILKGTVGEVQLDSDGYIEWVRIDKANECFVIYPLVNPNNNKYRMSVSQSQ